MQTQEVHRDRRGPMVVGGLLVLVGLVAVALQSAGIEVGQAIGDSGWPFFVILPGLILLIAAFFPTPPRGVGFAIAGSIVTTVGLILLVQNTTGLWATWAYAWALIPAAAGLGMLGYGLIRHETGITGAGARLASIGGILFLIGLWFFGPVLDGGEPPVQVGSSWPILLVGAGIVVLAWAVLGGSRESTPADLGGPQIGAGQTH